MEQNRLMLSSVARVRLGRLWGWVMASSVWVLMPVQNSRATVAPMMRLAGFSSRRVKLSRRSLPEASDFMNLYTLKMQAIP
jgi:hypothetical protein